MGSLGGTRTAPICGRAAASRKGKRELSAPAEADLSPTPSLVYGNLTLSFQSGFPREVASGHLDVLARTRVNRAIQPRRI